MLVEARRVPAVIYRGFRKIALVAYPKEPLAKVAGLKFDLSFTPCFSLGGVRQMYLGATVLTVCPRRKSESKPKTVETVREVLNRALTPS